MSESTIEMWTQQEAIDLARRIEEICPDYGCHVALTGGLLYKEGPRKDADFLFYRIRQVSHLNVDELFAALESKLAIFKVSGFDWCYKGRWKGKRIDFFFPDSDGSNEPSGSDEREVDPLLEPLLTVQLNP